MFRDVLDRGPLEGMEKDSCTGVTEETKAVSQE